MPEKVIRVLLADDHRLFRGGLRSLLNSVSHFEVVGEAGSGEEVMAKAAALRPDVILMDLQVPGLNGVETTRRILRTRPDVGVLVLTMFEDTDTPSLRLGSANHLPALPPPLPPSD